MAGIEGAKPLSNTAATRPQVEGEPGHQLQGQENKAWGESREGHPTLERRMPEGGDFAEPHAKRPGVARGVGSFPQSAGKSGGKR